MKDWKVTVRMPGLDQHIKDLGNAFGARSIFAIVTCKASDGYKNKPRDENASHKAMSTLDRAKEPRSAGKNITIFRSQRRKGRDPAFAAGREAQHIQQIWNKGIALYYKNNSIQELIRAGADIANYMVKITRDHIKFGISRKGKPKELKRGDEWTDITESSGDGARVYVESTSSKRKWMRRKRKKYGDYKDIYWGEDLPVLEKTGQLIESLIGDVKVIR